MTIHLIETSPNRRDWTARAAAITEQAAERMAEEARYQYPMCDVRVTAGEWVREQVPRQVRREAARV